MYSLSSLLFRATTFAVACAILLSACGGENSPNPPAPSDRSTFRIYSSLPTKGSAGYQAKQIREGIDLALAEKGKVGTYTLEHVALDGGGDENGDWSPTIEAANATQAANDPATLAYIGPYTSGATGVALPITNRADLLTLGVTATWPGLTLEGWWSQPPTGYFPTKRRNYARLSLSDATQGKAAARWASQLGTGEVLLVDDGSDYSMGLVETFASEATRLGLTITKKTQLPSDEKRFSQMVTEASARAIFYAPSSAASAVRFIQRLNATRFVGVVLLSDTALNDQLLELGESKTRNLRIVSNAGEPPEDSELWRSFAARFKAKYGSGPGIAAGRAFDLANLVLQALERGTASRPTVLGAVLNTHGYEGVTGSISFDDHGDRTDGSLVGYRIEGGRFVKDRVLKP